MAPSDGAALTQRSSGRFVVTIAVDGGPMCRGAGIDTHVLPLTTYPALQATPHAPAVHVAVPFAGTGQLFVQLPHRVGVVLRFASQPFVAFASQLPKPALHVNPQTPAAHVSEAFARAGQAVGQAPQ